MNKPRNLSQAEIDSRSAAMVVSLGGLSTRAALAVLHSAQRMVLNTEPQPDDESLEGPTRPGYPRPRERRPGRRSKIDLHTELRSFILEHERDHTLNELAEMTRTQFPPKLWVGKSAIGDWLQKQRQGLLGQR